MRKPVLGVSDQARFKPNFSAKAESNEISDLEVEGRYYLRNENKGTNQLHDYGTAELYLCFSKMQKAGFLMAQLKFEKTLTTSILMDPYELLL